MNLSNLGLDELKFLGRIADWAEHHAMLERSICSDQETTQRNQWTWEIQRLAEFQTSIRYEFEHKTGAPPHSVSYLP